MDLHVECLLCKEIVKCKQNDTITLVNHVKMKHPDIKISSLANEPANKKIKKLKEVKIENSKRSSFENLKITGIRLQKIMEGNKLKSQHKMLPKNKENEKKHQSKQIFQPSAKSRKLYKTSVEKWKPGSGNVFCPKCESMVRPMVRTSTERVSHNPIGAALIMTCWPFCFFPFLFPAPIQENLYCSICGYYFGTYDYEKQIMSVGKEPIKQNLKNYYRIFYQFGSWKETFNF